MKVYLADIAVNIDEIAIFDTERKALDYIIQKKYLVHLTCRYQTVTNVPLIKVQYPYDNCKDYLFISNKNEENDDGNGTFKRRFKIIENKIILLIQIE